jgi:hypothetical protein
MLPSVSTIDPDENTKGYGTWDLIQVVAAVRAI